MYFLHKIASWLLKGRISQIEYFMRNPTDVQLDIFWQLIEKSSHTDWGKKYHYADISSLEDFRQRVPISSYEKLYPWIERMMRGEPNVLWPDSVNWFAKSSGTTNDSSKFIPVTRESLYDCHFKAGKDLLAIYFHNHPNSNLFAGKLLSIGGSHQISHLNENARYGDLSAVLLENLPLFYEYRRTPSKKVALMSEWESKIEAMAQEVMDEDITAIVGVPTWSLILINRILEKKGITDKNLLEVWPRLEAFFHGAVNFDPYQDQFKALIPSANMGYINIYNASEGFFSIQNETDTDDMLLMLDYGIFYEFIPMEQIEAEHPNTHTLEEVEPGRNYAMVITTNGGLHRYLIGDTVMFTSINPFKIRITGRTRSFINAFGEEIVVENAERAITEACSHTGAIIRDYTAAPIYLEGSRQGAHEWLIEFNVPPGDPERFRNILDETLQKINTDYRAKREGDLALVAPTIRELPEGTFFQWMKSRNKLGGQNKVPRLANDRKYVDEILGILSKV
jgi:hypothetical protein